MELKVRCIDARFSKRGGPHKLHEGWCYTVIELVKEDFMGNNQFWRDAQKKVILKEFPKIPYLPRRFEVLDKELSITLPDDFDNLPIT